MMLRLMLWRKRLRMLDDKTRKDYEKLGISPPTSEGHGTDDDIRQNMKRLIPNSWRLEGDQLIGETEMGTLCQKIPTSHILVSTDTNGLPVFRRIDL